MKVIIGIIMGAVIGIFIITFAYFYLGNFTNNSYTNLGKAQVVNGSSNGSKIVNSLNNSGNQSAGGTSNQNNSSAVENNIINNLSGDTSSTANFDALLKGPYINGTIGGNSQVLISLNHPVIENGVMTLNEYYPSVPSETFKLEVVSPKANQFIMYEYYNGEHTGTYNLELNRYSLSGTFTHIENGLVSQVALNIYGAATSYIGSTPFLKGKIGNSSVVICTGSINSNEMTEFYVTEPKNVFTIRKTTNSGTTNCNKVVLDEFYNNKETGIYDGVINSNGVITGTFINLTTNVKSKFQLTPSYTN